jgi:periplasmic divalent cation tolerance protein
MIETWVLYSTLPSEEKAFFISRHLLEKRLIACANVYRGVTSLYRWEGAIQQEPEVVLVAKTRKELVPKAIEAVKSLHSYELPCIIAYPIAKGFPPFLQWIADETADAVDGDGA